MASETKTETISVNEARKEIASGNAVAVDVRSEEEWGDGHVPGATHLPDADADASAERLKDGKLAAEAASSLSDQGYEAVAVDGGMDDWISENFKTQPTEDPDEDTELGGG
jgi:rhodanese-related sulfurtransferase